MNRYMYQNKTSIKIQKCFFTVIILLFTIRVQSQDSNLDYCNCKDENIIENDSILKFKRYCSNVLYEVGRFNNGIPDGNFKVFDNKNVLIKDIEYKNGLLNNSYKLYNKHGQLKLNAYFDNGLKTGFWKYYNNSNNIKIEGEYSNNIPVGIWKYYADDGNLLLSFNFDDTTSKNIYFSNFFDFNEVRSEYMTYTSEWYLSYKLSHFYTFEVDIIGGYQVLDFALRNYIEINRDFWDTYFNRLLKIKIEIDDRGSSNIDYSEIFKYSKTNTDKVIPIIINTNKEEKIKNVNISDFSKNLQLIKLVELLNILPPISLKNSTTDFFLLLDINKGVYKK